MHCVPSRSRFLYVLFPLPGKPLLFHLFIFQISAQKLLPQGWLFELPLAILIAPCNSSSYHLSQLLTFVRPTRSLSCRNHLFYPVPSSNIFWMNETWHSDPYLTSVPSSELLILVSTCLLATPSFQSLRPKPWIHPWRLCFPHHLGSKAPPNPIR